MPRLPLFRTMLLIGVALGALGATSPAAFAGVTVEIIEHLDEHTVHAVIVMPILLEPQAKVYNYEVIRTVEIGDYIEVIRGLYDGCMGYATEDRWQSCRVYVDAMKPLEDNEYRSAALIKTWVRA